MLMPWTVLAEATPAQRRTLLAAYLGWMLDAFDVMLYALVVAYIMRDLHMTKPTVGLLNTLMLLASGLGGLLFGLIADRIGRARALALSILTYSIFSFASGLAQSVLQLAVFRTCLGLGMGGEWNTGATLVAETWPSRLRARAMAMVQSSWAIGYAMAALVSGIMLRYTNWRYVFFIGILPALVTLWIRRRVPESEMWKGAQKIKAGDETTASLAEATQSSPARERWVTADSELEPVSTGGTKLGDPDSLEFESPTTWDRSSSAAGKTWTLTDIFRPPLLRNTIPLLFLNLFGLFGWWGLFTWIPPYLSIPVSQGGRGFGVLSTTGLLLTLNLLGMLPGYLLFGPIADHLGRKGAFVLYLGAAGLLVPLYSLARSPQALMVMGIVVAFFGTGFFSGSGLIASELFPTAIRARALGVTYNGARMLSAFAPFVIGSFGQKHGLDSAFYLCAGAFLLAAVSVLPLPETRGRELS
jgi:MFS family permease